MSEHISSHINRLAAEFDVPVHVHDAATALATTYTAGQDRLRVAPEGIAVGALVTATQTDPQTPAIDPTEIAAATNVCPNTIKCRVKKLTDTPAR